MKRAADISSAIRSRRSVRRFRPDPVPDAVVSELVALACTAPAPHHSRPWRFVDVMSPETRTVLADAMSDAWRADLDAKGATVHEIDRLLRRSRAQIELAPVLLIACLVHGEAKEWPDERHRRAERDMFVQSLGAALQNILLAAGEFGLAGYLKGAPLFCADAVAEAAALPEAWEPAFLVLLGYPEEGFVPPSREEVDPDDFLIER